ncbi:MAG TPA: hypothetical protein VKU60_00540, partial [Chloroflexota bacterium]|nr:hypothetical protein [Chloroflexota bacterium]
MLSEAGVTRQVAAQASLPRLRIPRSTLWGIALLTVVAIFTVVPVGFVVIGSFNTADGGHQWQWGLGAWRQAFTTSRTLQSIGY